MALVLVAANGGAFAFTGWHGGAGAAGGGAALDLRPAHGTLGLSFGFGPWWGPYQSYAPPAYGYPPPVYAVPPPTRAEIPGFPRARAGGCREFQSTVIVDGQARVVHGLACPQPDGTWRIVQ